MRKALLYTALALVGLVALAGIVGFMLPAGHVAHANAEFRATPAKVYEVVTDFAKYPEWRTGVTALDVAGTPEAPLVTEHGPNGVIPYKVEQMQPPSRLVMRIADPNLSFGGTWTFEIEPNDSGADVVITENGEVYNPFFRVMGMLFFSPTDTLETYLADLKKRMGE